jgi:hypothetical protein
VIHGLGCALLFSVIHAIGQDSQVMNTKMRMQVIATAVVYFKRFYARYGTSNSPCRLIRIVTFGHTVEKSIA